MINIKLYKNGFVINGHAEYNDHGKDIVCAGVSAISQGFINSFNKDEISVLNVSEEGQIIFTLKKEMNPDILNIISSQLKTITIAYPKEINIESYNDFLELERKLKMKNFNKNINLNLQLFASKKGVGSTKNGRDSNPKNLGAKLGDGQYTKSGQIIYRQRGNKIYPGTNVGQGKDHTLFAKTEGTVKYSSFGDNKKKVSVFPLEK